MNLLIIATLAAVCSAAKLDRTYLPPASARTAGGSEASLQTPNAFSQNAAPKGSYTNDFQGVVVDAALAGTRGASGSEESGLGASRDSYGSTASKVGEAAFRGAQAGFRFPQGFGPNSAFAPQRQETDFEARESEGVELSGEPQFEDSRPERPQAAQERAANTLRFDSEVGIESFNYAFETDNGISAEETGTATNGVQAQGGYSYTGDDGKVYMVTYTADEGGYQPRGDHLPTPPPIPEEILKSLEQNARDEANGVVDDGMYDAQKYNAGGDYAESDSANGRQNGGPSAGAGNTDVDASGSFINQKHQPFNPNRHGDNDNTVNQFASQNNANRFDSRNEYLPPFQQTQNQRQQSNMDTSDADSSSTFQHESTEGSGNVQSQSQQNRPTSQSFASRTTSNQFNSFKQSTNGNQVNQNGNRSPMNRQQFGSAANTGSQDGRKQFSAHASPTFNSQHATSVPDTELTTPFETSPQDVQPAQSSAPSTNSLGFHNQPSHNGQSHFASQNSHFETSQASAQPTIPSFPQFKPQNSNNRPVSGNRNTQSGFSTQAPRQQEQFSQQSAFGGKRPQFSQNQFSQTSDSQFSSSTQRPQFAQQATGQDDSYYYNQPSRTFNTPQSPSRFSNAPANQFDRVTQRPSSSQTPREEEENYPSTAISSQNGQRQGQAPFRRPSFPTQSTPSDSQFQSNSISSATNGITQASASPFPAPTSAPSSNGQHSSHSRQQFQHSTFQSSRPSSPQPSKPSFSAQSTSQLQSSGDLSSQFEKQNFESAKPLSQQALQEVKEIKLDDDTTKAPVTNLQYNGEVYEYTKPAEMLPPPENGFGQFGTKIPSAQKQTDSQPQIGQSASAQATSQRQFGQSTNSAQATAQTFAPQSTQFTQSAKTQQGNQFGSRPQFGQATASTPASSKPFAPQPTQFSQSAQGSRQFGSRPQFGQSVTSSQQASESFAPQPTKFSQSAKTSQGSQFGSRPQFGQSITASQQATSESFAPQPTQFSQSAKTQQNTFGSSPQFGPSSHSQSQQSSFGSKPQFGQATQGDQFSAQTQESTDEFDAKPAQQFNAQSQTEQHSNQFQRRPSQGSFAAETPKPFSQGSPCCNGAFGQQPSFGKPSQDSSIASSFQSSSFKPAQTSSVAGKGEVFGGPRAPPSFDDTGYHY